MRILHQTIFFRFILIWACACQLQAKELIVTDIIDLNNQYTFETTFQKLHGKFPFITIGSTDMPQDVIQRKNITYVAYGNRQLQLDLYHPKKTSNKKLPALIFVHGGGWHSGYRNHFAPISIALAQRGYVAATISYRLSPEAKFPAAIYDAKNAIRWMRRNAKKYSVNPNQIVIAGGSAGGQIAALTGVTNSMSQFDGAPSDPKISSDAQAIINIDGLSDFTTAEARFYEDDPKKNPSAVGAWLGGRFSEIPDVWQQASPKYYVSKNTPPILFLISSEKRFSLGRVEMAEQLSTLDVFNQTVQIQEAPHSFWLFDPWITPSVEAIDNFLKTRFK